MVNDLEAAYASCEQAARSHYENFPVASLLVPAGMRRLRVEEVLYQPERAGALHR